MASQIAQKTKTEIEPERIIREGYQKKARSVAEREANIYTLKITSTVLLAILALGACIVANPSLLHQSFHLISNQYAGLILLPAGYAGILAISILRDKRKELSYACLETLRESYIKKPKENMPTLISKNKSLSAKLWKKVDYYRKSIEDIFLKKALSPMDVKQQLGAELENDCR